MKRICLTLATIAVLLLNICCVGGQQDSSTFVTTRDGK